MRPADRRSLPKSAEEVQTGEGYDGQERGDNMAGKGAQRTLACFLSVRMFPVTMDKGEDACRDKDQDKTESKEKTGPGGSMCGQHEETRLVRGQSCQVTDMVRNIDLSAGKHNPVADVQLVSCPRNTLADSEIESEENGSSGILDPSKQRLYCQSCSPFRDEALACV